MSRRVGERASTVRLARPSEPLPLRASLERAGVLVPILVVDPGPRTAWAVRWDQDHSASGVEVFNLADGEGPAHRVIRFRRWLRSLLVVTEAALVVHARPQVRGQRNRITRERIAAHQLEGMLLAEVEGAVDHVETTVRGVLRYLGQRPGAPDFIGAARERWGKPVTDEAEAYVLCTLAWAVDAYRGPVPRRP